MVWARQEVHGGRGTACMRVLQGGKGVVLHASNADLAPGCAPGLVSEAYILPFQHSCKRLVVEVLIYGRLESRAETWHGGPYHASKL
eukprot:352392-Pelagomonas_calceolata.AAC.3